MQSASLVSLLSIEPFFRGQASRHFCAARNACPAAFLIDITMESSRSSGSSTTPTGSETGTEEACGEQNDYPPRGIERKATLADVAIRGGGAAVI